MKPEDIEYRLVFLNALIQRMRETDKSSLPNGHLVRYAQQLDVISERVDELCSEMGVQIHDLCD